MDAKSIERELSAAFEADHKRKAEDSMKKRAILSARSYDEFRHLVAAATLKPMEKDDFQKKVELAPNRGLAGLTGASVRSKTSDTIGFGLPALIAVDDSSATAAAAASASASAGPASSAGGGASTPTPVVPASPADFDRAWRRLSKDKDRDVSGSRARYLVACGGPLLLKLLGAELDGDRLLDVASALMKGLAASPAPEGVTPAVTPAAAAGILMSLTASPGFDLALALLGPSDKGPVAAIAQAAQDAGDVEQADGLRKAFQL